MKTEHCRSNSIGNRRGRTVSPLLLVLFGCLASVVVSGLETSACQTESTEQAELDPAEIERLIEQLGASQFAQRQSATQQLTTAGESAIKPLTRHLVEGSPELHWRIRAILESIALDTSREGLLLAASVLKARFGYGTGELTAAWLQRRRKFAIEELRREGIQVLDTSELAGRGQFFGQGNFAQEVLIIRGNANGEPIFVQLDSAPGMTPSLDNLPVSSDANPQPSPMASERGRRELTKQLDSLLSASAEERDKFVFGRSPDASHDDLAPDSMPEPFDRYFRGAISLTFDQKWSGNTAVLNELDYFRLNSIHFDRIKLTKDLLNRFTGQEVAQLSVNRCVLEDQPSSLQLPQIEGLLSISHQPELQPLLDAIASVAPQAVQLTHCEIDVKTIETLADRGVLALTLNQIRVPPEAFAAFSQWEGLRMLELQACGFDAAQYEQLRDQRPRMSLDFTPAAFLGVSRSAIGSELKISRVVENSAAAAAGIQVDDIIQRVGQTDVRDFDHLRLLIAQYRIGEQISITVSRDGEVIELNAKLGENDDQIR